MDLVLTSAHIFLTKELSEAIVNVLGLKTGTLINVQIWFMKWPSLKVWIEIPRPEDCLQLLSLVS